MKKIRSNKVFELFVVFVIVFSAVMIGVRTYPIPDALRHSITVLDWLITIIFLIEIAIRFMAEPNKRRFFAMAGIFLIH